MKLLTKKNRRSKSQSQQSKHNSNKQQYQGNWNEYETSKRETNKENKRYLKIYPSIRKVNRQKTHIYILRCDFFYSHRNAENTKSKEKKGTKWWSYTDTSFEVTYLKKKKQQNIREANHTLTQTHTTTKSNWNSSKL